jgi:hypothetical protein
MGRRLASLLSGGILLALLAPAGASGAYTGTTLGTLDDSAAADTYLVISRSGGNLSHNLATGLGTFESNTDFESDNPGVQTLTNTGATTLTVNGNDGFDGVAVGEPDLASAKSDIAAQVVFNGGTNGDTLVLNDFTHATSRTATLDGSSVTGMGGQVSWSGIEFATVVHGIGNDTTNILANAVLVSMNVLGGLGDDTTAVGEGIDLNSGVLNGGPGTNTLDLSTQLPPVNLDNGGSTEAYGAVLSGLFETPATNSLAVGAAQVNFNPATSTFDFFGTAAGITPAQLNGAHIHRAPQGVAGPIISDLDEASWTGTVAGISRAFTGGTFTTPATDIPALRAEETYINLHSSNNLCPPAPNCGAGEIRGQFFRTGFIGTLDGDPIAGYCIALLPGAQTQTRPECTPAPPPPPPPPGETPPAIVPPTVTPPPTPAPTKAKKKCKKKKKGKSAAAAAKKCKKKKKRR